MANIKVAADADEFVNAYKDFIKSLKSLKDEGHSAIAYQCQNGLPGSWEIATGKMRQEQFIYALEGKKVVGLLRIQVEPKTTSVKLQDIVTLPGTKGVGAELINFTKGVAEEKGKTEVWLETADERLPSYYEKFGFKLTGGGTSGKMVAKI